MMKRRVAIDHLIEYTPETPNVRRSSDLEAPHALGELDGLGRHVVDGPDLVVPLDVGGVVGYGIGDSEVDEFELAFDEDEVGGFEVRVDDLFVVDDLDGLEHLDG